MIFFSENAVFCWVLAALAFFVLKVLTPTFFLVFFGIGALASALIALLIPGGTSTQWAVFVIVSLADLLLLRKRSGLSLKPAHAGNDSFSDPFVRGRYLGREVMIVKPVAPEQDGVAELDGTNWRARSVAGMFATGDRARVERVEDLLLIVAKIK